MIFLDQLFEPYKFHGSRMTRILFFNIASCEPLRTSIKDIKDVQWGDENSKKKKKNKEKIKMGDRKV